MCSGQREQPADEWSPQRVLSVSGSFQDDNLCSSQLPAPNTGFCGIYSSALMSLLCLLMVPLPFLLSLLLPITLLSFQPDSGVGPLLLAGYEDGSLLLWDVTQRSVLSQVRAHPEPVMCLTFDPKRLRGISGSSEKNLSSWMLDSQNNIQVSRFSCTSADLIHSVLLSAVVTFVVANL